MFEFASIMTIIFTIAKIVGYLNWTWVLVSSPMLAWLVVSVMFYILRLTTLKDVIKCKED